MPSSTRFACLLFSLAPLALSARASAQTPFLDTRVGGLGLIGPASIHPASVFYNPATMALMSGHHVYLEGAGTLTASVQQLAATDPATALPVNPTRLLPRQRLSTVSPRLFAHAQSDLGIDSVALGLTVATPATSTFSALVGSDGDYFDPARQPASQRYHAVDLSLFHLYLTPSAAVRVSEIFYVGLSFSFIFGSVDYAFVRDAALEGGRQRGPGEYVALDDCGPSGRCDFGADAAAEGVRIRGTSSGVALGGGILVRAHRTLDIGLGVNSGVVFGLAGRDAEGDAFVTRAEATYENGAADTSIVTPQRQLQGRGTIAYTLPNMISLGATWRGLDPLTLDLQLRWVNHSVHESLDIRLTGAAFRDAPQVPDHVVIHQGFKDSYALQLGGRYALTKRLTVETAAMVESPATSAGTVSPLLVDGWKLDALLALRWRFIDLLTLHVGYGIRWIPPRSVESSAFSPTHMVACVDGFFDVDLPACQAAEAGRGLASTAGRYDLVQQRVSLALGLDIW